MGKLFLYGTLLLSCFACTDKLYLSSVPPNDRRTVVQGDTLYSFTVAIDELSPRIKTEAYYTWYLRNGLSATQGGYEGTLLDGPYTKMLRDNTLLEKGQFEEGLKDGRWTTWQPNGAIEGINRWKQGEKQGDRRAYDTEGTLEQSRHYRRGELHGEETIYLPFPGSTHRTKQVRNWEEGNLTGEFTIYDSLDRLYQQGSYQNGELDGEVITYEYHAVPGQRPKTTTQIGTYQEGQRHGKFVERYPDGHIQRQGAYRYGALHGRIVSYELTSSSDKKAYAKQVYSWKDEQYHGPFKEYYANGKPRRRGSYRNGQLHGKLVQWDEEGEKTIRQYKKGQLVEKKQRDKGVKSLTKKLKRDKKSEESEEELEHLPNN